MFFRQNQQFIHHIDPKYILSEMVRRMRTLVDIIAVIISLVNSGNINSDNLKKITRDSLVFKTLE